MNEAETRAELIDPALKAAGWSVIEGSRILREVITLGRLQGAGTRAKQDIADYVLVYRNQKLAVIEAKRENAPVTQGLAQAKNTVVGGWRHSCGRAEAQLWAGLPSRNAAHLLNVYRLTKTPRPSPESPKSSR